MADLKPSASTVGSGVGGAISVVLMFIVHQIWPTVEFTGEVAASLATIFATFGGYFLNGGRQSDTV
jgi:hypothetical protein